MSATALSPGPLFSSVGVNRKFTPVRLDATPKQIKDTFKRLASVYNISYISIYVIYDH